MIMEINLRRVSTLLDPSVHKVFVSTIKKRKIVVFFLKGSTHLFYPPSYKSPRTQNGVTVHSLSKLGIAPVLTGTSPFHCSVIEKWILPPTTISKSISAKPFYTIFCGYRVSNEIESLLLNYRHYLNEPKSNRT